LSSAALQCLEMAEEISNEARKGAFDRISRLHHRAVCEKCGCSGKKYIECLKEGEFEIGQAEQVLVAYPGQYYLLNYEAETLTPIFIVMKCQRCGFEKKITDPVLTVEYLQSFGKRKERMGLYV